MLRTGVAVEKLAHFDFAKTASLQETLQAILTAAPINPPDGKTDSIGTLLQRVESCPKESFPPATVAL
jgi:hypothetical protein